MARKTVYTGSISAPGAFLDSLEQVSTLQVDANTATGRRTSGRTANALEQLKSEAHTQAYEAGYEEGFHLGRAEGLAHVENEYRVALSDYTEALQSKVDQVVFAMGQWVVDAESRLAELSVAIAAGILAQEISTPQDTITSLVRETLAEVKLSESARIRVNPFDLPCLSERKVEILGASSQLRQIEFVDDPTILGGCVIESDAGLIDATIGTRLELALEAIREAA